MPKPTLVVSVPTNCEGRCPSEATRVYIRNMAVEDIEALEKITNEGAPNVDHSLVINRLVEKAFNTLDYPCEGPRIVENQPPLGAAAMVCPRYLVAQQAIMNAVTLRAVMNGGYSAEAVREQPGQYL